MGVADEAWAKKRGEQLAALRKNFEDCEVDSSEDLSNPVAYENLIEQLGRLPFHLAFDLVP